MKKIIQYPLDKGLTSKLLTDLNEKKKSDSNKIWGGGNKINRHFLKEEIHMAKGIRKNALHH